MFSIEQERLLSLIAYAQQSTKLASKTVSKIEQHGIFSLFEHQIQGLPGIRLNTNSSDSDDEIWLTIERLRETKAPEIINPILLPWVHLTNDPTEEPQLKSSIDRSDLIHSASNRVSLGEGITSEDQQNALHPSDTLLLTDFEQASEVKAAFYAYKTSRWKPWSFEEIQRRKTIKIYTQLYTLKQHLEGAIVPTQLEVVWGIGIGIWQFGGTAVNYPLVARLTEVSINPVTSTIEIRPRDTEANIEIDWYASKNNPGVAELERVAKAFFGTASITFSPFDRLTFEPLLQSAATNLDANGVYWPNVASPDDRTLPKAEHNLKITDTWVLFARPRTNNIFVQDLEILADKIKNTKPDLLPPASLELVSDPIDSNPEFELPSFRGVSASYHIEKAVYAKERDLFFPKPYNDEQVRIVQLLEVFNGVVVQGPPGTGKTHTIANVICHYLANGHRVLVTSMKDAALGVLREQLPDEIRNLTISLLTSEQEGMKQFEYAIRKIASEIQAFSRSETAREIRDLDEYIDGLHIKLARIDREICNWAKTNLERILVDGENIAPEDAARETVRGSLMCKLITDKINISSEFAPQFSEQDVLLLREARRKLGYDIDYLGASLPQLAEFPEPKELLALHQDLSRFELLKRSLDKGEIPSLADSSEKSIVTAQQLVEHIARIKKLRAEIASTNRLWVTKLKNELRFHQPRKEDLLSMFESLGIDLNKAAESRMAFLKRPVEAPPNFDQDRELMEAVENLSAGKSAFGFTGIIGKSQQKKDLHSVRIMGSSPSTQEEWTHAHDYFKLRLQLRELGIRWNTLAQELQIDLIPNAEPEDIILAINHYKTYLSLKELVKMEAELTNIAKLAFPGWQQSNTVADNPESLSDLEKALHHNLTKNRLANVWSVKIRIQKILHGRTGRIVDRIQTFLAESVGNTMVSDLELQNGWTELMRDLTQALTLGYYLSAVREVCRKIEESGAPQFAAQLKTPMNTAHDPLLPDNLRQVWRLKRISVYLDSIDTGDKLTRLAKDRKEIENDLAKGYRDVVTKRTWLKLSENASPSIRSALAAYLTAMQKIGKGTGKRAVRYRRDAREASAKANSAVPCWIMPHYRVSESLPSDLGCFDLVVIDEASQSDLAALPALLRAKKILVVGDDKQVSPEGVGLEEDRVRKLMDRFLQTQIPIYRPQMSPERSMYDLFKVVFAKSAVMLKEHFRCVAPIIEFSKREFYNHEIRPLRIPKSSERIDPPLVDVLIAHGYRDGDKNRAEAQFILDEIKAITLDPKMTRRTIGVVSLLGDKQAMEIWNKLAETIGPERIEQHQIACGDARTFQGKERDIMFLSMVVAPNDLGIAFSRDTFAQRFNVAASRARDRMYLVRSVELENLSTSDILRRSLIKHFEMPFLQNEVQLENLRLLCESEFEREVFDELIQRGFRVIPQVRIGRFRIDLMIEGDNDERLAVECDGDRFHGPERWVDDIQRQRVLERAGLIFWRCFYSQFIRQKQLMMDDLLQTIKERGIEPVSGESVPRSIHTERRVILTQIENSQIAPLPQISKTYNLDEVQETGNRWAADLSPNLRAPSQVLISNYSDGQIPVSDAPEVHMSNALDTKPLKAKSDKEDLTVRVLELCRAMRLKMVDNRSKGGALWVIGPSWNDSISQDLKSWGFRFAVGKGWWIK